MPKIGRIIKLSFASSIKTHGSLNAVKIPANSEKGNRKGSVEVFTGWRPSGDPKLAHGIDEERRIDRENNLYEKTWRDARTGKRIGHKKEPLKEHRPNVKKTIQGSN